MLYNFFIMASGNRFDRDQISKILKRAAELEHKNHINDDGDGLSVEELQEVAKEVGLHPKYIRLAAEELERPSPSFLSKIFGGPFNYRHSSVVEGTLSNKKWEEIVAQIRHSIGKNGKPSKFGDTFEWELRDDETQHLQIYVSPQGEQTSIQINADFKNYAALIYGALGTMGVTLIAVLIPILFKKAGLPLAPLLTFGGIGLLSFAAGLRFYLSRWTKKKRKTYSRLVNRLQEILSPENENLHSPSITLPEIDSENVQANNTVDKNREKTK